MDALRGCDLILHAGDIGAPDIVGELAGLAPVTAIRGNVDRGGWAHAFPETATAEIDAGALVHMLHDIATLDIDPAAAGVRAVLYGHSHKPEFNWHGGVLYVNPGSAGPRRFSLPLSVGRLRVEDGRLSVELIELEERGPARLRSRRR